MSCIMYLLHPIDDVDANEDVEPVDNTPWADSDRDYAYEEVSVVMLTPHNIASYMQVHSAIHC